MSTLKGGTGFTPSSETEALAALTIATDEPAITEMATNGAFFRNSLAGIPLGNALCFSTGAALIL